MSVATTTIAPARSGTPVLGRLAWTIADAATVMWRNLLGYLRIPEALFFSSVQPVMFVLLFRYVFGDAIHPPPHTSYVNFLIPGIFVQTVSFGAVATSIALAEDLHKGLIERFRALPMARSAVLAGRCLADVVRNVFVVVLITGVGYAVGFRVQTSFLPYLAGVCLLVFFAFAMSWGFAIIGLSSPNAETAQVAAFPLLFPLTFASSAFVPVNLMPGWLQGWAKYQPVSVICSTARALMNGGPTAFHVWQSLAWICGLLVVLVPFAVSRYRKVS